MTAPHYPAYQLMQELERCFDNLMAALEVLAKRYEEQRPLTWTLLPTNDTSSEWFRTAMFDVWHQPGQDGRETRNYLGIVVANDALIDAAHNVNLAKEAFHTGLQKIKNTSPKALSDAKARLTTRHPEVKSVLRKEGLARLHLKQCWRQLPIADAEVSKVRFAWYQSGRSIKRITVREAEQKLLQLDAEAPHVKLQLRRLAGLPSGEPLAQVQPQAPLMRANLFFTHPLADGHTRRALNVAMPLFVPSTSAGLPNIKAPPSHPQPTRTRATRRDEKLESDVFLPSLRVYRYRS
ncbi:DNA replication terminus site-binding protein [Halomonas sp. HL-93]|uniref:DNA replication terminus site-binding protein n=1 Tax=Halomonas sp. HL-93 TaxID=1666906 RepID=UPI0006DA321A|nr:DNA replication terminus site-binding protein [Halomonas sp. HL-93]KPQ18958.1 MAG: DNA replication terminus site binding protein [Halomonas sp. HL-93]SBR48981.1 DNA replication terminus site binding protein [Halomonas sp. HL-93]